jgi:hypothetical protein
VTQPASGRLIAGVTVETGAAEVEIRGPLLDRRFPRSGVSMLADRSRALVRIPEVATFAVLGGARVVVEPAAGADPIAVDAWLQGTVQAFAMAQRGLFALHANAADIEGRCVAICGARGVGKSTAVLRLGQRGHAMVADDICPLELGDGGVVTHHPARRSARVSPQTAEALGIDVSGAVESTTEGKVILPAPAAEPGPVESIVALLVRDTETVIRRRLPPSNAVAVLRGNAYREGVIGRIWPAELFQWAAGLASRVPVVLVTRPRERWTVDDVADAIEEAADEAGM